MKWPSFVAVTILATGCLELEAGAVPARTSSTSATDPGLPGIHLRLNHSGEGDRHTILATAANQGSHTYKVSAICAPVFTDEVKDSSGKKVWPQPYGFCAAFGLKDFGPGARLTHRTYWNETRWSEPDSTTAATPGTYRWTVTFHVYRDEHSGQTPLNATITMNVS